MHYRSLCTLCACLALFSGCFLKKKPVDAGVTKLSQLGISLKIPENFLPLPREQLQNLEMLGATVLDVDPFTVIPQYAYAEQTGKGIMVVSQLQFSEGVEPEKYPLNNIFIYKKNLETYFSGEISSEEISGNDVTTVLMVMILQEDEDDIAFIKGLSYVYPDRFFMIDVYAVKDKNTVDDASNYMNTFLSLGIY